MRSLAMIFVVALFSLLSGLGIPDSQGQKLVPRKVLVEGFVFDSAGKPLGGVDVAVWVVGKEGAVTGRKTDPATGKYSFEAEVGGSFDVSYTMSRFHPSVVTHLAEKKNQQISKVLYQRGERIPASVAHELIQSIDRFGFLALSLPRESRTTFLARIDEMSGTKIFASFFDDLQFASDVNDELKTVLSEQAAETSKKLRRVLGIK